MTSKTLSPQEILALPLDGPGFLVSKTVGQYLMSTLGKFLRDGADFDSKRPFGSSDWEDPLIIAFANANLMWLRTDEFEQIDDYPTEKFAKILNDLAFFLLNADFSTLQLPPEPKEWYVVYLATSARTLEDHFMEPLTEEEAKIKAEENNAPFEGTPWKAIHIPPTA